MLKYRNSSDFPPHADEVESDSLIPDQRCNLCLCILGCYPQVIQESKSYRRDFTRGRFFPPDCLFTNKEIFQAEKNNSTVTKHEICSSFITNDTVPFITCSEIVGR